MVAILRNSVTLILLILAATGFIYFLYYLSGPDVSEELFDWLINYNLGTNLATGN